jgi:hypothetical protein
MRSGGSAAAQRTFAMTHADTLPELLTLNGMNLVGHGS